MSNQASKVTDARNAEHVYQPENLKRWTMPQCYFGAEWYDYYSSGVGQSRDSDALERSNFKTMLADLGGETGEDDNGICGVVVVRENHWAVGWVEWIAIHESNIEALKIADKNKAGLEDYPVLDEEDFCKEEMEEANEVWTNCFDAQERIEYIREHRTQFEFHDFADLLSCVRGKYFAGYACELLG